MLLTIIIIMAVLHLCHLLVAVVAVVRLEDFRHFLPPQQHLLLLLVVVVLVVAAMGMLPLLHYCYPCLLPLLQAPITIIMLLQLIIIINKVRLDLTPSHPLISSSNSSSSITIITSISSSWEEVEEMVVEIPWTLVLVVIIIVDSATEAVA